MILQIPFLHFLMKLMPRDSFENSYFHVLILSVSSSAVRTLKENVPQVFSEIFSMGFFGLIWKIELKMKTLKMLESFSGDFCLVVCFFVCLGFFFVLHSLLFAKTLITKELQDNIVNYYNYRSTYHSLHFLLTI